MISRTMTGERDRTFRTVSWPRSMRLAISTSPSRVSSGTVPISRRYMRTGSLVFSSAPGVRSSSTLAFGLLRFRISFRREFCRARRKFWSSVSMTSMPAVPNAENRSSRSSAEAADFRRQKVADFVVKEVALLLADIDQLLHLIVLFVKAADNGSSKAELLDRDVLFGVVRCEFSYDCVLSFLYSLIRCSLLFSSLERRDAAPSVTISCVFRTNSGRRARCRTV